MSYPGYFAPLDRQHARESLAEQAAEHLIDLFAAGEWTPCRDCGLTVDGDQLLAVDPCDEDVLTHMEELEEEAAERYADRVAEDRWH
jgi:hypothetical protein